MHIATALAGCRKSLVITGWTISLLFDTNRHRKGSSAIVGALFLAQQRAFSWEKHSLIGEP